nr:hypothetical protein HK105_007325 [Polyrhizophydium stewartii]
MPPTHSRLVRLPAFEDPAHMSGEESRELALRLLGQSAGMPPEALVLVARTDAGFTAAFDNMDLGDKQPESYTSPNFHPGRVVLVGDAAHGVALGAHGSVGGSLAIADAVVLAKLLAQYFKPDAPPVTAETAAAAAAAAAQAASATQASAGVSASATSTISRGLSLGNSVIEALLSPVAAVTGPALAEGAAPVFSDGSDVEKDGLRLKLVAGKFTALRLPAGNASCVNARAETTWTRQDEGFWKNLVRMSVGYTWARSTFSQMLMRGAPTMGDESVTWPALSRFSK